ncbi:hypothetical protein PD885_01397 [Xanthomonas fragariae]|uniref:Transposase n=1 Tax=Xanthomonas fragariae TaxID=48664 RepID=A0ABY1RMZ6_9XANT|nr:hypothetical protein NBC2815_02599 [Xanthomonas fragariae]SMQ98648.1 hypothetical protein PD885_01397 [Xanthomonas fragariae]
MAHGKQVVCAAMYKLLQLADGVLKSALRLTRKERLSADKGRRYPGIYTKHGATRPGLSHWPACASRTTHHATSGHHQAADRQLR